MSTHLTEPSSPPQPSDDQRNPKAEAKAAKAYAKAMRPWYKKKRFLLTGAAIGLVVMVSLSSSSGTTSTAPTLSENGPAASAPANTESAAPAKSHTATMPIQDGDWRLDSIRVKDDGLGSFGGTARVTYTGENPEGGSNVFTLTVFKGGKDIAVLNGSADSVQPGQTATVQFISTDKFVGGPYTYDFQNDL